MVQFLVEHGASVHDRIGKDDSGPDVLGIVRQSPKVTSEDHPIMEYLLNLMAESEL